MTGKRYLGGKPIAPVLVYFNGDPCTDDPKSFGCANKIEFCNGHPTERQCQFKTPLPPVTRQYNCIAEQASSKYPTCPGGVENDPSYVCFEQVGQTVCSRGAYDPCVESLVSPACKLEQDFCNSNPTDPRKLCNHGESSLRQRSVNTVA